MLTFAALTDGWGLDVARFGEAERALPVDGDAEGRRVAAERGAEALRLGLHHGPELRAARAARLLRAVAADVVHARGQAHQRRRAVAVAGLRGRRCDQQRDRGQGQEAGACSRCHVLDLVFSFLRGCLQSSWKLDWVLLATLSIRSKLVCSASQVRWV